MIFKKVGDNWKHEYVLVTEEMFFEDYSNEPKNYWNKGIEIRYKREKKWDYFIKVNGEYYYDVRYIIANYEEDFDVLDKRLNRLREDFSNIEEVKKGLLEQEVKIKELLEQYQKIEIIEGDSNE